MVASLAWLLATCGCASANRSIYPPARSDEQHIYVLDNHWHTALILPTDKLPTALRRQLGVLAIDPYVAVGWGDEGFFRSPKITAPLALQAMFYSRGSVLQVFRLVDPPNAFARDITIYRLPVSTAGLERIMARIAESFVLRDGRIVDAGSTANDGRFFYARGRYCLFHTCNQWTAERLHDGGLPITAAYAGLASNFEWQMRRPSVVGLVEFRNAERPADGP